MCVPLKQSVTKDTVSLAADMHIPSRSTTTTSHQDGSPVLSLSVDHEVPLSPNHCPSSPFTLGGAQGTMSFRHKRQLKEQEELTLQRMGKLGSLEWSSILQHGKPPRRCFKA